ncbi:MAG: hypothetical protein ACTHJ3_19515 [Pararhizobium sp.]
MSDFSDEVEDLIADISEAEREIGREFANEGFSHIRDAMEEGDYLQAFDFVRERILSLLDILRERLGRLRSASVETVETGEAREDVLKMMELHSRLMGLWSRLEDLVDLTRQKMTAAGRLSSALQTTASWLSTLQSWLKRIGGQLWQLLLRLITPKEWKLSGSVGAAPFGLASATIEITFG